MAQRILIVEDSPTQLITLKRMLESKEHAILTATNATEGLVRAYNDLPDLIVSDVVMSGINGYQLCRLVKNDPELSAIPFVLLTKLDGSIDRFWGMKSGADRFIPKEPGFPSLLQAVNELLESTRSSAKLRLVPEPSRTPTVEEINSKLNQLLERLLFEATIIDEVRKISDEATDLETVADQLFQLLSTVISYKASALCINNGTHSVVFTDHTKQINERALISYTARVSIQLGIPPVDRSVVEMHFNPENALTQPIDSKDGRLGLLIVVPETISAYKPGDQKVVRTICEQLSMVLRLFQMQRTGRIEDGRSGMQKESPV